jgi:hypothetical protein
MLRGVDHNHSQLIQRSGLRKTKKTLDSCNKYHKLLGAFFLSLWVNTSCGLILTKLNISGSNIICGQTAADFCSQCLELFFPYKINLERWIWWWKKSKLILKAQLICGPKWNLLRICCRRNGSFNPTENRIPAKWISDRTRGSLCHNKIIFTSLMMLRISTLWTLFCRVIGQSINP